MLYEDISDEAKHNLVLTSAVVIGHNSGSGNFREGSWSGSGVELGSIRLGQEQVVGQVTKIVPPSGKLTRQEN